MSDEQLLTVLRHMTKKRKVLRDEYTRVKEETNDKLYLDVHFVNSSLAEIEELQYAILGLLDEHFL